ncbi:Insect cuticle protein [Popillia japonica]|uniref:Insect cuticle protein n=1 Tax=Popillia japonica TaxID=7064 RepID=A0AAW1MHH2_POPJA
MSSIAYDCGGERGPMTTPYLTNIKARQYGFRGTLDKIQSYNMFKIAVFAAVLVAVNAGVPLGYGGYGGYAAPVAAYSAAPAVSYSYNSAPFAKVAAAPVAAYAAPAYAAHTSYAPAISHAAFAPAVSHAAYAPAISHAAYAPAVARVAPVASYAHSVPAYASYAAPIAKVAAPVYAKAVVAEPVAPAVYDFGYSVSDPHTGDSKSQQESRRGDQVQGSYSLIEADGSKRVVEYVADAHNGFNAVVHREPAAVAVKAVAPVAKYAAPVVSYGGPVVAKYAAPALYH